MSMNVSFSDIPNQENESNVLNHFEQKPIILQDPDGFFCCRLSDQKYKSSRSMVRHNRFVHLGMSKYQCKGCLKKFFERRDWVRHLDQHRESSGEFSCTKLMQVNYNKKNGVKSSKRESRGMWTDGDDFENVNGDEASVLLNKRELTEINQQTTQQKSSLEWLLFQTEGQLEERISEKPFNRLPNPSNTTQCGQDMVPDQVALSQFQIKIEHRQTYDLPNYHGSGEDKFRINPEVKMEEQCQVEVAYLEGQYFCGACSFITSHESEIVNHAHSVHLICKCKGECQCNMAAGGSKIPNGTTLNDDMPCEPNLQNEYYKSSEIALMPKPVRSFSCHYCSYSSQATNNLERHMKDIHKESMTFKCQFCPKSFLSKEVYWHHQKCFHKSQPKSFENKLNTEQNEPLSYNGQMQADKCDISANSEDITGDESQMVEITFQDKKFHCSACNYNSNEMCVIKRHIIQHHRVQPKDFTCPSCGKITWYNFSMTKHLEICPGDYITHIRFDGEAFICAICHQKLKTKSHAVQHVRSVHFKVKKFKCQNCDQRCNSKASLMSHFAICQSFTFGVTPNKEVEEKTKLKSDELIKVKTSDLKDTGHSIPETVSMPQHLKSMKEDLSEKYIALNFQGDYFFCPHCNHKFPAKYKSHLIRHIRTVNLKRGDFECQNCYRGYFYKRSLLTHVKRFTDKAGNLTCKGNTI